MDLGHGEVVRKRAVASDFELFVMAGDEDVVNVEDLGEGLGNAAEGLGEAAGLGFVARELGRLLDGSGLGLDVGEDGGEAGGLRRGCSDSRRCDEVRERLAGAGFHPLRGAVQGVARYRTA